MKFWSTVWRQSSSDQTCFEEASYKTIELQSCRKTTGTKGHVRLPQLFVTSPSMSGWLDKWREMFWESVVIYSVNHRNIRTKCQAQTSSKVVTTLELTGIWQIQQSFAIPFQLISQDHQESSHVFAKNKHTICNSRQSWDYWSIFVVVHPWLFQWISTLHLPQRTQPFSVIVSKGFLWMG